MGELTPKVPEIAENADHTVNRIKRGTLSGNKSGLTEAERKVVDDLLKSGKNVEIIPRSNISGVKTPDFKIDGILTELKTLTGSSLNTPVTRIVDGFAQGAQKVLIDGRQTGLTIEQANTVVDRAIGSMGGKLPGEVEFWTIDGILRRMLTIR